MIRFLFMTLLGFGFMTPVWSDESQSSSTKVIPNTAFLMPMDKNISAKWTLPSIKGLLLSEWVNYRFRLDNKNNIWFCKTNNTLMCPSKHIFFIVDKPIDDYLWLRNGDFLVTSQNHLGYIASPKEESESTTCIFKSVLTLPVNPAYLSPAGSNGFFIWGTNEESGKMCVYRVKKRHTKKSKPIQLLFTTDKNITAVGGDADHLFVALNSLIIQVKSKTIKGILNLKDVPVRNLDFLEGTGLFYGTDKGAGVVDIQHKKSLDFIQSPGVNIALGMNNSLFVKLDSASGILKIDGISYFNLSPSNGKDSK